MAKFILKIILILLPLVAAIIALEAIARKMPSTYNTKLSFFNAKKKQIEILVMGSSHANFGIDPKYFGRAAFNLSNTSQCLYQDYQLIMKYLPSCPNIKMVILPISYFSLQSDLAKSPEAWRIPYYSYYMGIGQNRGLQALNLRNYSALFLWDGPLQVLKNRRHTSRMNINEYGYQTPETSRLSLNQIINDNTGIKRAAYHDKFMDKSLLEFNCNILEEMSKELRKRDIKIVFLTTPVYKTYYQHVTEKNYRLMTSTTTRIAGKYSAPFFNYFYDSRFDMDDFSDNDHLSAKGAKKFSEILKNEVIDNLL